MTARFFADTHIAVCALDADPQRHEQAFAILQRRPVISTQIVNEFINVLTGKQRVPLDRVNRCARILLRRSVFDDIGFFNGTTKASDDEFFQRLGAFTTQHGGEIREVERPEHDRRFFRYPVIRDLIPVAPDMSRLANPDLPVIACLCSITERIERLQQTLNSLAPQVDALHLYLDRP